MTALGEPTIAIISMGGPYALASVIDKLPAVFTDYYGGPHQAIALADAMFGVMNPGGRLPFTVPRHVGQVPIHYAMEPGPVEVSVGSSSNDIRSSAILNVTGKTRVIKGEDRAFLSVAMVGCKHKSTQWLTSRQGAYDMKPKNTICLWFNKDAHEAARFYAATFPDSEVTAVHKAPGDYPGGKAGDVLTVDFTVLGIPCLGLNGGPEFRHSEAFSFQIATDNQEETDRYWNAIVGNGGQESQCGWCKDRWGLSWQITPRALTEAMAAGGGEAKRAFAAMMPMKKIDIATIEAARRG